MPSKKKVVLFLVEGPSDETAIRGPVNLLIQTPSTRTPRHFTEMSRLRKSNIRPSTGSRTVSETP